MPIIIRFIFLIGLVVLASCNSSSEPIIDKDKVPEKPVATDCSGNFTLGSPEDLAALIDLDINAENLSINSLRISGPELTNLDGLEVITTICDDLTIDNNPMLENLNGLSNLTTVGSLTIFRNSILTDLTGLDSLSSEVSKLTIELNDSLINLKGLGKLSSVRFFAIIKDNKALVDLEGLNALTTVGKFLTKNTLEIQQNSVSYITDLEISGNDSLESISGMNSLTSIGGSLYINNNTLLKNLDGLASISEVSGTSIVNNSNLDCSPYNSQPYRLSIFPVDTSTRNKVDCVTE